jgi:hypothetical protein
VAQPVDRPLVTDPHSCVFMCTVTTVRDLSALHTKRLMVNFDTDESVQEREIDILTSQVTDIFRHAEGILKKFGRQGDEASISAQEKVVRTNLQRSMAKKLQGLSTAFRTSQKVPCAMLIIMSHASASSSFPCKFVPFPL